MVPIYRFEEEGKVDKEKIKPGRKVKVASGEWEGQTGTVLGYASEWSTGKWKAPVRLARPGQGVWESIVPIDTNFLEPK